MLPDDIPLEPRARSRGSNSDQRTGSNTSELFQVVYDEMRTLAAHRLRQLRPGQTLQATALVHEVYLKLASGSDHHWDGEGHFFAAAAQAMREILVDRARSKSRIKRGGRCRRIEFDASAIMDAASSENVTLVEIDDALRRLEVLDPQRAQIVTMKFFAGLTTAQAADCLGLSERTLEREWQFARVWLHRELNEPGATACKSARCAEPGPRQDRLHAGNPYCPSRNQTAEDACATSPK